MTIALTIKAQIGNRAFAMMGASQLINIESGLKWKVGRNAKKVTHIIVMLNADDTYRVIFWSIRGTKTKILSEVESVYVDNLREVIEHGTGFYLSL